jgi:hypothetical protein
MRIEKQELVGKVVKNVFLIWHGKYKINSDSKNKS